MLLHFGRKNFFILINTLCISKTRDVILTIHTVAHFIIVNCYYLFIHYLVIRYSLFTLLLSNYRVLSTQSFSITLDVWYRSWLNAAYINWKICVRKNDEICTFDLCGMRDHRDGIYLSGRWIRMHRNKWFGVNFEISITIACGRGAAIPGMWYTIITWWKLWNYTEVSIIT